MQPHMTFVSFILDKFVPMQRVFFFGLLSLSIFFFFYFYFYKIVLYATAYDFCLFHLDKFVPMQRVFFLSPFVSFNFFLLLLFLQGCPLLSISFWTNLSLCNVFFSLAFCLFQFFSSTSISSRLSPMQPHMTFSSFILDKFVPMQRSVFFFGCD